MKSHLARWLIALTLATLVMGLALAHAAYAGEAPRPHDATSSMHFDKHR